jgi:uncharacterized protein DUF6152
MSRVPSVVSVALLIGVVCSAAVSAHHSVQSEYDVNGKKVTVSGTVAKIEFLNPHSYLTLNIKDADGKITKWGFELGGVAKLRKAGLSRADQGGLKPGDEVTATALPARNGSNNGYLLELQVSDGRDFKFTTEQN